MEGKITINQLQKFNNADSIILVLEQGWRRRRVRVVNFARREVINISKHLGAGVSLSLFPLNQSQQFFSRIHFLITLPFLPGNFWEERGEGGGPNSSKYNNFSIALGKRYNYILGQFFITLVYALLNRAVPIRNSVHTGPNWALYCSGKLNDCIEIGASRKCGMQNVAEGGKEGDFSESTLWDASVEFFEICCYC